MVGKKVAFGSKPQPKKSSAVSKDEWVKNRSSEEVKMKRLTIDVSEDLHRRIKSGCASRGVKMADEIRTLLDEHFEPTK